MKTSMVLQCGARSTSPILKGVFTRASCLRSLVFIKMGKRREVSVGVKKYSPLIVVR